MEPQTFAMETLLLVMSKHGGGKPFHLYFCATVLSCTLV